MTLLMPKGSREMVSEHFHAFEFDCRCPFEDCHETVISDYLLEALEMLRHEAGERIYVLEGYRCERWNRAIGGVVGSYNIIGKAAAITIRSGVSKLRECVERVPRFRRGGIGVFQGKVDVDVRGYRSRWYGPGVTIPRVEREKEFA
jgi:zinc D-Ala-D-Ala carboxypeptidase